MFGKFYNHTTSIRASTPESLPPRKKRRLAGATVRFRSYEIFLHKEGKNTVTPLLILNLFRDHRCFSPTQRPIRGSAPQVISLRI